VLPLYAIVVDLQTPLTAVAQETAKKFATRLFYYQCNVTDEQAVTDTFAKLIVPALIHPIRGLVNCVGVSDNYPAVEFPVDKFRRLFDINVVGTLIVAQAVAREVMKTNVSASMVLVGSISGSVSNRVSNSLPYVSTSLH
jgi:NAD(P)-dependent dehydrogenase (short-subunit alcohol dehydrogenase family)